ERQDAPKPNAGITGTVPAIIEDSDKRRNYVSQQDGLERAALPMELADVRFLPLSGTANEAEIVGHKLGVTPLTGSEALKSTIKHLKSPKILHIATHGFFLENSTYEYFDEVGISVTIAAEHVIGGRL